MTMSDETNTPEEHQESVVGDCERTQIANLVGHAIQHDNGGESCLNYRSQLVAELMFALDLQITDLGYIADDYLELVFSEQVDAKDLFQSE